MIRSDIGRQTFGTGIEFGTSELRWTMEQLREGTQSPVTAKTRDTMKWLQLGTLRFPNGDSSFLYVAGDPEASLLGGRGAYGTRSQWSKFLTPEEIISYTDSAPDKLNMERVFEVNSVFWLNYSGPDGKWELRYIDDRFNKYKGCVSTLPPPLCSKDIATAASKAAEWVVRDKGRTQLWEVGNEDWSRLQGPEYAEIFFAFQEKMKGARRDIKLLAQGLAEEINGNTPASWLNALKKKLQDNNAMDSVYAYSVHQYLRADLYASDDLASRRHKQTQDMLANVAENKPLKNVRELLGTDVPTSPTKNWKIWMTEFNLWQPTGIKNELGNNTVATIQDMGHALVIADWTGQMLEHNVERMFMNSMDHHPAFAVVQYKNLGASLEDPRVTVPGFAYAMYAQKFGKTMVRNNISGNPSLKAPNGKSYPQLAVYSSISEDNKSLVVMVINRNLNDSVHFNLNTRNLAGGRKLANGNYSHTQLRSTYITDTNASGEQVKWTEPIYSPQKESGLDKVTVLPASANLFTLPLQ